MAPSKDVRSLSGRSSGVLLDSLWRRSSEQREVSGTGSHKNSRANDKDTRDGGNGGDGKGGGGKDGGGNGGNNDGGKDKDPKENNKSGDNNNNDNNNNNNNNNNNDSTTTTVLPPLATPELPPLAIPAAAAPPPPPPPAVTSIPLLTPPSTTSVLTTASPLTTISPLTTTSEATSVAVISTTSVLTSVEMTTLTSVIPVMTTSPLEVISSQPRKGVDGPPTGFPTFLPELETTSVATIAFTATDTSVSSSATAVADDDGQDNNKHHNGNKDKNNDKKQNGQLDPAAEHALIAVGSIGAFVILCFIAWIVYRTLKKSRQRGLDGMNGGFFNNLPWRRDRNSQGWDNRSMVMANELPPNYEKGDMNSMQNAGFYGQEKMYQPRPGSLSRSNTTGSQRSLFPQSLAPGSVVVIPAEQYMAMSQAQSVVGSDIGASTMRSRMPDTFFNQSELARQPSDAYDPARRQVNRASELSSLSSGFGDGDIIIPGMLTEPPPAATPLRQSNNFLGRFSWMGRGDQRDRDTIYTTTSEDRPARYRTVSSWVNQQTGRAKRAGDRKQGDGDIPPVPDLPSTMSTGDLR
ncbi:hypothetical protein BJ170DRAFT_683286 [Xylariales sp. AK1849]|nr:hypothetical protein BJ170DRAFT_683286 [Xylariales sp. AK1849]